MLAVRRTRLRLRLRTYYHIDRDTSPIANRTPSVALVAQGGLGEGTRVPKVSTKSARLGRGGRYKQYR